MAVIHTLCLYDTFTLLEDWAVEVEWHKQNLLMLAAYKLTGQIRVQTYGHKYDYATSSYILDAKGERIPNTRKETVPNKLFMNDDGEYEAALITIPQGTVFKVTKMVLTSLIRDSVLHPTIQYNFKCINSPKTEIKNRILLMNVHELKDLNCTIQQNSI